MGAHPPKLTGPAAPDDLMDNGARRVLLKDRALAELKRMIRSGELSPGLFLTERQLADRLGMSKTPVRSALEQLEALGLVTVSPQQGILVREPSLPEVVDMFELRTAVEPYVVRRLASRRLDPDLNRRLTDNLAAHQEAVKAAEILRATDLDREFHILLAEGLGNREVVRLLDRAFDKLHRTLLLIWRHGPGRLLEARQEHAGIVKAVRAGQPDVAAERMDVHLRYARQFLVSV